MALIFAVWYLGVVLLMIFLALALGLRLLQGLGVANQLGALEELLYSAGISFALLGVVTLAMGTMGWLRHGTALILLAAAGILAGPGWHRLYALMAEIPRVGKKIRQSGVAQLLAAGIASCVVLDSLLAMAPLTGSDALVYHFTIPLLGLSKGPGPVLWLIKSFWIGQGHSLIELGLALGSDRIAMGLILAGGMLTASALFVLTRHLTSDRWAGLGTLILFLTPMVYWQIGTSGCPDIWMAFYTTLAVMAVSRGVHRGENRWLILAGVFGGAAAGVKFTGWAIPVGIVTYCLLATRSMLRTATCGLWFLPAGILPIFRNAWLTGDPFFPFLTRILRPGTFNSYTLKSIMLDTHSIGFNHSAVRLLAFPFLLSLRGEAFGFGHYFGPFVLALSPLLPFALRRVGLAHAAAIVWGVVFLLTALTSQWARFLLPVFPLALALVIAGVAEVCQRGWPAVKVACAGTVLVSLLFGLGSEVLYARDFLPVAVGLESRDSYLARMAPDYPVTPFINSALEGQKGNVMVFFQHVYYLRIPFLIGDPNVSWLMDPDRRPGPQALMQLLRQQNVHWVVKAPDYPKAFASAFQTLEDEGKLHPRFSENSSAELGYRIYGETTSVHVVILEVESAP